VIEKEQQLMNIYTDSDEYCPYTYLIGWSKLDKWYYGSESGITKNANPKNLWTTYYTSSKYVKSFREIYGDPDVITVRKTFQTREAALAWEYTVLRRLKVTKTDKWLNKSIGGIGFGCVLMGDDNPSKRLEVREKISLKLTGRSFTDSALEKMRQAKVGLNKGKTYEEIYGVDQALLLKKSRSKSQKGKPKTDKQINASTEAASKWWRVYPPNEVPFIVFNLHQYCKQHSLDTATMHGIAYHPFNNNGKFRYHKGYRVESLKSSDDDTLIHENVYENMVSDKRTKVYNIIHPDGKTEIVRGLQEYAQQQGWPPGSLYDVKDKVCANGEPRKYKGFIVKTQEKTY